MSVEIKSEEIEDKKIVQILNLNESKLDGNEVSNEKIYSLNAHSDGMILQLL